MAEETTEITVNLGQASALFLCVDAYIRDLMESLTYHERILSGEVIDPDYGNDMEKVKEAINFENQVLRDLHSIHPEIKEAVLYFDDGDDTPSIILP